MLGVAKFIEFSLHFANNVHAVKHKGKGNSVSDALLGLGITVRYPRKIVCDVSVSVT